MPFEVATIVNKVCKCKFNLSVKIFRNSVFSFLSKKFRLIKKSSESFSLQ